MIHVMLGGVINGRIRYEILEKVTISENNSASIIPLAQKDVMQTFLFGINNDLINDMANAIVVHVDKKLEEIETKYFVSGKKDEIQTELNKAVPNIVKQVAVSANTKYLSPILQSVTTLPLDELTSFAESMINITSVRRQVALDGNIGTVGGPIDVAVISKGDGFVWIKRKHFYDTDFGQELSPNHYNKLKELKDEKKEKK